MIKVALDAMGGDFAPSVCIEGAVNAVKKNPNIHVVLCGPEAEVKASLEKLGYAGNQISVVDAPDPVAMDEHPVMVVKKKQHSGLVTCVALQKKGLVEPIGVALPTKDRRIVLVDGGANVDERASTLVDFAIAGSAFAEAFLGIENPKVGLLNMGEEEHKGPAVLQETYQLLKSAPVNFIGNIEGRDLIAGKADVVASSGYTGNVVLKLLEGFFEMHQEMFGTIDSPAGKRFAEMWDYRATGGALLLGLNGIGIIAHGRSDALAIEKAVEAAAKYAEADVANKVNARLAAIKSEEAPKA